MLTVVEYIWISKNNAIRSKTRVILLDLQQNNILEQIPNWNYDGSSTDEASTSSSEVILKPCAIYKDPFRRKDSSFLVLCDTYTRDDLPLESNHRFWANHIFNQKLDEEPWFGIEQEYFLMDPMTNLPLGFPANGKQGQYYCSNGYGNAFGRDIVE